jgi:hypothetical protein
VAPVRPSLRPPTLFEAAGNQRRPLARDIPDLRPDRPAGGSTGSRPPIVYGQLSAPGAAVVTPEFQLDGYLGNRTLVRKHPYRNTNLPGERAA